jgi:hypothetical protein
MIAPLDQVDAETAETRRRLRLARRLVASTFFQHRPEPREDAPPIPAWRAWGFTAWVVIVTAVYIATMLGSL